MANSISLMNRERWLWALTALVGLAAVVWGAAAWGGWAAALAVTFAVFPDLALIGAFADGGRLKPHRVPLYNRLHRLAGPALLLAIGAPYHLLAKHPGSWAPGLAALAWFVHVAADRACGYGLREPDGTIRPVGVRR